MLLEDVFEDRNLSASIDFKPVLDCVVDYRAILRHDSFPSVLEEYFSEPS